MDLNIKDISEPVDKNDKACAPDKLFEIHHFFRPSSGFTNPNGTKVSSWNDFRIETANC